MIDLYPLDGFFFNMFRFAEYDYAKRYRGVSQSESARGGLRRVQRRQAASDRTGLAGLRSLARLCRQSGRATSAPGSPSTSRRGGPTRPAALRRPRLLRGEQRGRPRAVAPPRQRDDQRLPHAAAASAGAVPLRVVHRHALPDRERAARAPRPAPDPGHVARGEPLDLHHGRAWGDRVSLARASAREITRFHRDNNEVYHGLVPARRMSASSVPTALAMSLARFNEANAEFRGLYLLPAGGAYPVRRGARRGHSRHGTTNGGLDRYSVLVLADVGPLARRRRPAL